MAEGYAVLFRDAIEVSAERHVEALRVREIDETSDVLRGVATDLRGRGDSDKPASGYRTADHDTDLLALLDALGLARG